MLFLARALLLNSFNGSIKSAGLLTATRRNFSATARYHYSDRFFTRDHEWLKFSSDSEATLGITDYAQKALGDVVYVEVVEVGTKVNGKGAIGAVESVKAASDVYCPVSAEVIGVNDEVVKTPSLINEDPLEKGWICKVRLTGTAQAWQQAKAGLLSADQYSKHCEEAADK